MTHSNAFKLIMTSYQDTKFQSLKRSRRHLNGFTLVETMIAGLIMSIVLVGISRFSISAISISSHQSMRRTIEATMNNDIQLIQQADSELKLINIPEEEKIDACENPGLFLKNKLLSPNSPFYVPEPDASNLSNGTSLIRTIDSNVDPILTIVTYIISAPEKNINTETRNLKLYPNFHHLCDVN